MRILMPIEVNGISYPELEDFFKVSFAPSLDIKKCFQHHQILSEYQRLAHERLNEAALQSCIALDYNSTNRDDYDYECVRWEIIEDLIHLALELTKNPCCLQWAIRSLTEISGCKTNIRMKMHQYRMFINHGITLDYFLRKKMQSNKPRYFTYNGRTETIFEWSKIFNIPYNSLRRKLVDQGQTLEQVLKYRVQNTITYPKN